MSKKLLTIISLLTISGSFSIYAQETNKRYGVEPYQSREKNITFEEMRSRSLPSNVDLLEQQTEVKNQDQRGSCAFFSATALLESEIKRITEEDVNISEEFLIRYTKGVLKQGETSDGSNAGNNLNAFRSAGFALEKDVPYQPDWFGKGLPCDGIDTKNKTLVKQKNCYSHGRPTSSMLSNAYRLNGMSVKTITPEYGENLVTAIKKVLAQGRSVVISVPVNFNGWDSSTGNSYHNDTLQKECDQNPDDCGAHSILIAGYDDELPAKFGNKDVEGALIFKNSWGRDWGQGGYGKFPYQMINDWGYNAYDIEITNSVYLPQNHSKFSQTSLENLVIDFEKTNNQLISKFSGDLSLYKNAMFYASAFIANENDQILQYDGSYPRGVFYYNMQNQSELSFDQQEITLDLDVWNQVTEDVSTPKIRFSTYVYTDTDSWKVISRDFIPFN